MIQGVETRGGFSEFRSSSAQVDKVEELVFLRPSADESFKDVLRRDDLVGREPASKVVDIGGLRLAMLPEERTHVENAWHCQAPKVAATPDGVSGMA